MLQNFTIRNFRLFEELDLDPLRRVNLFVGKNHPPGADPRLQ